MAYKLLVMENPSLEFKNKGLLILPRFSYNPQGIFYRPPYNSFLPFRLPFNPYETGRAYFFLSLDILFSDTSLGC